MDFPGALAYLKGATDYRHIARTGWNGKGMYLTIQYPDAHSANTLPYIWIHTAQGERVPWVASQGDLLGNDWETVELSRLA